MSTARELAVLISGSNQASPGLKQLQKDLEGIGGEASKTGKAADDASKGFGNLIAQGAKLGAGFVGVTSAVAVFQKLTASVADTVGNASNLNETVNKSDVVFGSASAAVKSFGDTAAQAIGQSKQQAVAAASDFGNLFKSMGTGQAAAADMSVGMVKLASDLASFHNIDSASALEKLRAGLVGEAEPMRTLGVLLDEETVKLKAVSMGLSDNADKLTQAQKVQARYAIILEQTKDAQGDFARTSDGLANSQRIVDASLADLSATLGDELLPSVASVTSTFAKALPEAIAETKKALSILGDLIDRNVVPSMQSLAKTWEVKVNFVSDLSQYVVPYDPNKLMAGVEQRVDALLLSKAPKLNMDELTSAMKAQEQDLAELRLGWREYADGVDQSANNAFLAKAPVDNLTAALMQQAAMDKDSKELGIFGAELLAKAQEKAAAEAKKLASEAEAAGKKMATAMENARERAEDLADKIASTGETTVAELTRIGEQHGQTINQAIVDTANAIARATEQALDAIEALEERERISGKVSQLRSELSERLSGEQRIFNQQMDDEEFHHQESIKLARINAEEQRKLAGEKDERERQIIRITAQQERDALRQAHVDHDAEVQWRIQQEDKVISFRRDQERARADLERQLHEDELGREKARIEERKQAAIDAANAEFVDRKTKADKQAREDIARVGDTATAAVKEMETNFFKKLPEAAAGGFAGLATMLDQTVGAAVRAIAEAMANVQGTTGTGGENGDGGRWENGEYIDPRHQPGGDIFEAWKVNEPKQYEDWVRERGVEGFARGGIVPGPVGSPRLILAHGGETVTPVGGGVTQIIQMNGSYVGFDRTSLELLARELKPYIDNLVSI